MNIKEHIEAGHYPTDEKGRALVRLKNGETATICATDNPYGAVPIVGWTNVGPDSWGECGNWQTGTHARDLLPPPPRKVPVRVKLRADKNAPCGWTVDFFSRDAGGALPHSLLLAGEYEVSWDAEAQSSPPDTK